MSVALHHSLGERHLRRTLQEFATHYHHERNHRALGTSWLIVQRPTSELAQFVARNKSARILSDYLLGDRVAPQDSVVGQKAIEHC
jgi:hypothetical protein